MQLSKQERKYRYKLFYENRYNKTMQQDLDSYVKMHNVTYKLLYLRESLPDMFMMYPTKLAVRRLTKALSKLGISIRDAGNSFKNFSDILSELSEKWNETQHTDKKESST